MKSIKYYCFKPMTIYKLFESVIRPKLEYALCTIANKRRIEEITKIQKRAIRIALQVKRQTATWKLMEVVNGKSMSDKLDELRIKMWHKYKCAPDYLLQHWTYKRWKEYIEANDPLSMDENGNITINPARLNYVAKSPLSKAYNVVKSLYGKKKKENILHQKTESVMKPPPVYEITYLRKRECRL